MKINAIQCLKCKDIIYSRARHDYRSCSCGDCSVDGGFDYMRMGYKTKNGYKHKKININLTKEDLYDDWNKGEDKFGLVKGP